MALSVLENSSCCLNVHIVILFFLCPRFHSFIEHLCILLVFLISTPLIFRRLCFRNVPKAVTDSDLKILCLKTLKQSRLRLLVFHFIRRVFRISRHDLSPSPCGLPGLAYTHCTPFYFVVLFVCPVTFVIRNPLPLLICTIVLLYISSHILYPPDLSRDLVTADDLEKHFIAQGVPFTPDDLLLPAVNPSAVKSSKVMLDLTRLK